MSMFLIVQCKVNLLDIIVFEDKCNNITEEEKLSYWNKFEKLLCQFIDDGYFLSYLQFIAKSQFV